ncbi:MAG: DNA primase [Candidatus Paceibacterota bacterium]|jgi:DNA primase
MSSSVEKIKERLNIEDVVGSYIKLERAGNNLKAKCPFHNEKTPSFFVSPERSSYYCFGCGAKGDIFSFVQNFEGLDFVGALKILAERAGIELEKFATPKDDKKTRLYTLLEATTLFLQKNLASEEIPLEYLKKRGLTDKTIKDWRIGYVRDEWRSIYDHLKSKGFSDDEMLRAGMVKTENNSTYDRFRGRIMFPIFDSAGRVIAFSGRILHDDGKSAKYLNSPQTEIFDKSKTLYGFDRAKQAIRKFDFSVLVEGQMDLLMAHQAGFANTVASSGTALTAEHLKLLKRISNRVIMSFDSDNAGAKASERGWMLSLATGMEVKVAAIPKGFDPADLILKDKEEFKKVLKDAVHIIDFILDRAIVENPDKRKAGLVIKSRALPYLSLLESNMEKSHYVKSISDKTSIKEDAIWEDLKNIKLDSEYEVKAEVIGAKEDKKVGILKAGTVERSLGAIIALEESSSKKLIDPKSLRGKVEEALGKEKYKEFSDELFKLSSELAFEAESYYGETDAEKFNKETEYLLLNLQEENLKKELADLMSEMKVAENAKESDKAISLLKRCDDITKLLHKIKTEKNKKFK